MTQDRLASYLPDRFKPGFSFVTGKKKDGKNKAPAPLVPPPDLEFKKDLLRAYSSIYHSVGGQLLVEEKQGELARLYQSPRTTSGQELLEGRIQELKKVIDDLKTADTRLAELEAKYPTVLKPKETKL